MSLTVWLLASALGYPEGGGHLWVYLNWALGLHALGCRVFWLEAVDPSMPAEQVQGLAACLTSRLDPYGLAPCVALCWPGLPPRSVSVQGLDLEEADLLLNLAYSQGTLVRGGFRRSALIDIDPGQTQIWMSEGLMKVPDHDVYFTIGETVGQESSRLPSVGRKWQYTPPCVALDWWPTCRAPDDAPFTTVSHWFSKDWFTLEGKLQRNDKRSGFLPFLDLPRHTAQPLELALCLRADENLRLTDDEEEERRRLEQQGWHVRHAHTVALTPWDYQSYVQKSRGEFSCVKPSCVHWQNAWVSDRTLCYLASGKPAIVQHTGPSRFLPDAAGLFRFHDLPEAAWCLDTVAADYERQCRLARALAEEYFDAAKVVGSVLERALA